MKRIVICEGKTDAILMGYLLCKTRSLCHVKNNIIHIPVNSSNQNIAWFGKNESSPEFAIFSVGGIDNVSNAIETIVSRNKIERNQNLLFERALVVIDMDDHGIDQKIDTYKKWLLDADVVLNDEDGVTNNFWSTYQYKNGATPSQIKQIEFALCVLPEDSDGSLETFLLGSLSGEDPLNQIVVNAARVFINGLSDVSFVKPRRYKEKACLGSALSVFFPDWVFTKIDQKLKSVPWETFGGTSCLREILADL